MPFEKGNKHGLRFGEGQLINKKGAPKGQRLSTLLNKLIEEKSSTLGLNFDNDITGKEALALELLSIAFGKDVKPSDKLSAIKEIFDRIEGKPTIHQEAAETSISWIEKKTYDVDFSELTNEELRERAKLVNSISEKETFKKTGL